MICILEDYCGVNEDIIFETDCEENRLCELIDCALEYFESDSNRTWINGKLITFDGCDYSEDFLFKMLKELGYSVDMHITDVMTVGWK